MLLPSTTYCTSVSLKLVECVASVQVFLMEGGGGGGAERRS